MKNKQIKYVNYYEYKKDHNGNYIKSWMGIAKFLSWGVDYEELEYGVGNFSTAIIETGTGIIKNIPVENIDFV